MKIRICAIVLIFLQLLILISCEQKTNYDFDYIIINDNNEVYLQSIGDYQEKTLTIPSKTNDGNLVKGISDEAFSGNMTIEKIIIPDSIKQLNTMAFSYCTNLKSVYIGANVEIICELAFAYCNELQEIIVDTNNEKYESINNCVIEKTSRKLIAGCRSSIIPDDVKIIDANSFVGIQALETIDIPESVIEIKTHAFLECENLKEIYLGKNITLISTAAFLYCYQLKIYTSYSDKPDGWENEWNVINAKTEPYIYAEVFWNTP